MNFVKRVLDFILSLIALIILFPVFLIIGIAIKIDSKGFVFFKQVQQTFQFHKYL
ncbi:sugar transferase [Anaerosalibacter massiliensis]|uniref:sugar transferase n=1 Tax=Anaerosalibacter massiliensis TaxID=1347392 RepID=UPI0009DFD587|nr:sugar transferase [Anaerosalibacter massiliensis]